MQDILFKAAVIVAAWLLLDILILPTVTRWIKWRTSMEYFDDDRQWERTKKRFNGEEDDIF